MAASSGLRGFKVGSLRLSLSFGVFVLLSIGLTIIRTELSRVTSQNLTLLVPASSEDEDLLLPKQESRYGNLFTTVSNYTGLFL